ncbi:hypothetical protein GWK47_041284 [Chionoecetes opilio]|uniref:Uncharacterized protein n=1 Tax=Chionoecetes opilio TaxID=41210 RepID=A0A8J4YBJ5_CHIOP|nr:hypothetical protein GWK47_041284 [Chionoecetes opilio]
MRHCEAAGHTPHHKVHAHPPRPLGPNLPNLTDACLIVKVVNSILSRTLLTPRHFQAQTDEVRHTMVTCLFCEVRWLSWSHAVPMCDCSGIATFLRQKTLPGADLFFQPAGLLVWPLKVSLRINALCDAQPKNILVTDCIRNHRLEVSCAWGAQRLLVSLCFFLYCGLAPVRGLTLVLVLSPLREKFCLPFQGVRPRAPGFSSFSPPPFDFPWGRTPAPLQWILWGFM